MERIFFESWNGILRTAILTTLAYFAMIFFLRVSGKRTLTKMNAFDFIVTIALGSTLATVALNKNVTLSDGIVAFFLLIFLQALLTWLSVRSRKIKNLITSDPSILHYKGETLHHVLKKERITIEELMMAARKKGIFDLKEVDMVVLETTGDIAFIKDATQADPKMIKDLQNYPNIKSQNNP